jgi:O-antigen chain-terminating methyltransferase
MSENLSETNNSEIEIDKLMEKIREEVRKRYQETGKSLHDKSQDRSNETETEEPVIDTSAIRSIIKTAEDRADIGAEVTPMLQFRGLTQKVARLAGKAVIYLSSFITDKQRSFNRDVIHAMRAVTDSLDHVGNKIVTEEQNEITRLRGEVNSLRNLQADVKTNLDVTTYLENLFNERESRIRDLEQTIKDIKNNYAIETEKQNQTKQATTRLRGEVNTLRSIQAEMKTSLKTITYLENVLKERESRIRDLEQTIKDIKSRTILREKNFKDRDIKINDLTYAINDLKKLQSLQEGNIKHQVAHIVELEKYITHLLDRLVSRDRYKIPDNWYVSYENKFRGSREEIKERQKVFLPYIKEVGTGSGEYPVLDLGCGRGEWLELLRENGLKGVGVDNNRMMLSICQEKKLDVIEHDCVKFLSQQKSNSLGAITGFHILEHLPIDELNNLLLETVRVLKTGGVAIFETPNPQNILVASYSFYMDPTHRKPLPSPLLEFLAEECGLKNIEILNIHPLPAESRLPGTDVSKRFNEHFYGPQDYAIIGYKE